MSSQPQHSVAVEAKPAQHSPADTRDFLQDDSPTEVGRNVQEASPLYGRARGRYMNQSFISLIANVGSNASFNTQADLERREGSRDDNSLARSYYSLKGERSNLEHSSTANRRERSDVPRATSERKMLQSMPALPKPFSRKKHKPTLNDAMTSSQILSPPEKPRKPSPDLPDPTIHASDSEQSTQHPSQEYTESDILRAGMNLPVSKQVEDSNVNLPDMLVQMFGLKEREEVVAEYPCYLIQSSLLQGYMYIMQKHICFYAYLPQRTQAVLRSGFLSKRGRNNPKYNRYWFILKGDVLSYYTNAAQLYFPRGTIDLRNAASAQIIHTNENDMSQTSFSVSIAQLDVLFKADSATSAAEWVKQIQGVIFRLRNGGDSIKITLPVRNILDLENNPVLDAADTFRFKVIDNDETYAVDEYFFTFFGCGQAALVDLRAVLDSKSAGLQKEAAALEPVREIGAAIDTSDAPANPNSGDPGLGPTITTPEPLAFGSTTKAPNVPLAQQQSSADFVSDPGGQENSPESMRIIPTTNFPGKHHLLADGGTSVSTQSLLGLEGSKTPERRDSLGSGTRIPADSSDKALRPMIQHSTSYTKLQEVFRAGVAPLQKATDIAAILRTKSQRVGSLLASESVGYYEKAYSMWAGKRMHYDDIEGPAAHLTDEGHRENEVNHGDRFRAHFTLPITEKLQATYYSYLHRIVPIYGKIYLGTSKICFRSLLPGTRTKMILPLKDIENANQEKGFRFGYSGLVITIRGHEEIFFEFRHSEARDDCAVTVLEMVEAVRYLQDSRILSQEEKWSIEAAKTEHELLQQARRNSQGNPEQNVYLEHSNFATEVSPILFDDPYASIVNFKPPQPLKITCLTIGSRGDVQPFIALCKGLIAEGHHPKIATHSEFGDWIKSHGIEFVPVAGNPAEIMRLCVENDMFTVSFIREAHTKFRGFIGELLDTAWAACQGSDLLIESPSAMAGIHIAEALQIPYFRAFTMPWTRTRAYPHAFAVPTQKLGGNYNMMTYVMFDNLFWQAMAGQINRWRRKTLELPSTNLDKLQADKVPFLYNFSPSVVVPPKDFNHWIRITGYWFLDEGTKYSPDSRLATFIKQAKNDGKKLVYVGFGSVVVDNPAELTRAVVEAVLKADVRCILSKGWSDRLDKDVASKAEIPLPDAILQIQSAPHDWLFRQVDAAAHHGGAGTTGASIRAGIPTITKPFFGDQYFFGSRIEDLGVGICLPEITAAGLAGALIKATTDSKLVARARMLGEQIRSENGVETAIQAIYRDLDYAKSLIKKQAAAEGVTDELEESWTMVGKESDLEGAQRLPGLQGPEFHSSLAQRRQSVTSGESALAQDDEASLRSSEESGSDESNDEAEDEEAGVEDSR